MKSLFYALVLLAVLVASVLLLQSLETAPRDLPLSGRDGPVVKSLGLSETGMVSDDLKDAAPEEIYAVGMELLNLWHEREAAQVFELSTAVDSSFYQAWVRLVECYSHPLVCREDAARAAWERAWDTRQGAADTTYLKGLRALYIDGDYDEASRRLGLVRGYDEGREGDAHYHLALALYKAGRVDEAGRVLEDLLNRDDTIGRVMELSVRCAAAQGDHATAEERARTLARIYSEEPQPYVSLAAAALQRGDVAQAVEFCNNALVLDAKFIPAILLRANLYAAERRLEPARVSFEKCLLFDDSVVRAAGMEGIAFVDFLSGDFDDGVAAMDEAVRFAVLAGSVRRALFYAYRLIEYLCELGQGDTADAVVARWITGFGEVPVELGRLRIRILNGEMEAVRRSIPKIRTDREWANWMRILDVDSTAIEALFYVSSEDHKGALRLLDSAPRAAVPDATRSFLRGYSHFESGDAEAAARAFGEVTHGLFTTEFPYHDNPVLYVQSFFYLGETLLARGGGSDAASYYKSFLDYWGEPDWEIQAVGRSREKMQNMTGRAAE